MLCQNDNDSDLDFGRKRFWECATYCPLKVIDPKLDGKVPYQVEGFEIGSTRNGACTSAKRIASGQAPRGTHTKHCHCSCN